MSATKRVKVISAIGNQFESLSAPKAETLKKNGLTEAECAELIKGTKMLQAETRVKHAERSAPELTETTLAYKLLPKQPWKKGKHNTGVSFLKFSTRLDVVKGGSLRRKVIDRLVALKFKETNRTSTRSSDLDSLMPYSNGNVFVSPDKRFKVTVEYYVSYSREKNPLIVCIYPTDE